MMAENLVSPLHPHEPEIPPTLDAEGRCRVCLLTARLEAAEERVQSVEAAYAELIKEVLADEPS